MGSGNSHEEINLYLRQLHTILINFYKHNSLIINSHKTEYMHMDKNIDKNLHTITDEKGNIVKPKTVMKVLGIKINKNNNLRAHISYMNSKVTMTYNKIKEALPFMTSMVRKIVFNAKIRGQVNMYLPLFINQNQNIQKYFKTEKEKICNRINMPLPKDEIIKSSAKLIQ